MRYRPYYEFRDEMVERLRKDLLGPTSEEEILTDRPSEKYIVGILFPQPTERSERQVGEPENDVSSFLRNPEDDHSVITDDYDDAVAMSNVSYPSSMGLSFAVDTTLGTRIEVYVEAARYLRQEGEVGQSVWRRVPLRADPVEIDVSTPGSERKPLTVDGLQLYYRVRRMAGGVASCTVTLINSHRQPSTADRDVRAELAFYQPVIRVKTKENALAFVDRRSAAPRSLDPELQSYQLLYRHAKEFAVGHGCSVHWEEPVGSAAGVSEIRTEFVPTYELLLADSNPRIRTDGLSMKKLGEGDRADVCLTLRELCNGYAQWIEELQQGIDREVPASLRDVARDHISLCNDALKRMLAGVELLEQDGKVWKAFQLMNLAMLQQRARSEWHRAGRPESGVEESTDHRWRPFQIAFILLCLRGIVRPEHPERKITDLLWFPTGGGKTEAYLGLIAFTVFYRRLRDPRTGGGVTALMRYTLRLLTIQQFQRATLLICACERIRRRMRADLDLGDEPISIGLWLGQDATPNTRKKAKESLERLRAGETVTRANPKQVDECPWCGTPLNVRRNYYQHKETEILTIACQTPGCEFRDGLPLYLVDEDVYAVRPTLIIATADKFATIPWREESGAIFNVGSTAPPPELIIQDELHLISGPLGTLAGLYETGVSRLCTRNGVGPKHIASTATIRRANEQVLALFGSSEVRQFPPPGIDARDSYFAVESSKDKRGTRRYVGVMAPSTSHATLLVRTYASLLHSAANVQGTDNIRDQYWTLVGYFGSLRVLGAATMQVRDDVSLRLNLLANLLGERRRDIENVLELTSNVAGPEIPANLRAIEVRYDDPDQCPVDVVLATNMISVGVDVDRLGVMAVMGQPQSTSEYIQATSRVGRRNPGLVVTMFNAARSRDRSHYEAFRSYHQAMYRQVESTSVTPFSARARDRALHAVLIALVRQIIPAMASNNGAALVAGHLAEIRELIDLIVDRVTLVSPGEAEATRAQLNDILEAWVVKAARFPQLVYENGENPVGALMISAADDRVEESPPIPTMWSFRDVDKESALYFVSE